MIPAGASSRLRASFIQIHIRGHMAEKAVVAGTEIIEARLAVGCGAKSVFRTLAIARLKPPALAAPAGQAVALGGAKALWRSEAIISAMVERWILPNRYSGNTKWSQE